MKKIAWIIALIAALSFGFLTCAEPDGSSYAPRILPPEPTELRVVFDLQDSSNGDVPHGIQELPEGAPTFPSSGGGPIAPLVKAGEIPAHISSFEIVKVGGKNALKYVTVANWGPGFDLPISAFGFIAGDKIVITGTAEGSTVDLALNRNQGAARQIIGDQITSEGAFTITAELTAADITAIAGNEQKVIRFEDRVGGTTVTITQITIEGQRPSDALAAPVVSLAGSVLSWSAINGATNYRVIANTNLIATQTETSIDLQYALNGRADGAYSVSVVATGTGIRDSAASNVAAYNFTYFKVPVTITIGGAAVDTEVKMIGSSVRFEGITNGFKVTAGASASSYPVVVIDLSALTPAKKLSDVSSIAFKAEHISGAGANNKQFQVSAAKNATAPSGFKAVTRKSTQKWAVPNTGATPAISVSTPVFEALVNDARFKGEDKLVLFLNPDNAAATVVYEVSDIVITLSGNVPDEEIAGDLLDVELDAPVTGVAPKTTISQEDAAGNIAYTGTVIWTPSVGSSFDIFLQYTAAITLTPALTYRFVQPANAATPATDPGFTVNGEAIENDFIESFGKVGFSYIFPRTVNFPEEFAITIQDATGATEEVKYADIRTINAKITPTANGYIQASDGNNYDWVLAAFEIDLGDKKLEDFKEVKLTYSSLTGDYRFKILKMLAAKAKVGDTGGLPTAGGFDHNALAVTPGTRTTSYSNQTEDEGNLAPKNMTLPIPGPAADDSNGAAFDALKGESKLEIAFYMHSDTVSYSIANITFVLKD